MNPQEAIDKLREAQEMLTKNQEYLRGKIKQEIMIAKNNGIKNKRVALQALKRKKRFEQQLIQIDGTLSSIRVLQEELENANITTEVLKNMSMAAKAFERVHGEIDMDNIDSLMDNITGQLQIAQEISEAISQPFGDEFDEDELLAEMEGMVPSPRPSHRKPAMKKTSPTRTGVTNNQVTGIHRKLVPRRTEQDIHLSAMEKTSRTPTGVNNNQVIGIHRFSPAMRKARVCHPMPNPQPLDAVLFPSPDKIGGLYQEGHPASNLC
ncbi:charged multivesicular body protein 4b-like [Clarias gariepinus]